MDWEMEMQSTTTHSKIQLGKDGASGCGWKEDRAREKEEGERDRHRSVLVASDLQKHAARS